MCTLDVGDILTIVGICVVALLTLLGFYFNFCFKPKKDVKMQKEQEDRKEKKEKLEQHLESLVNVLKKLKDIVIKDNIIEISLKRHNAPKLIDIQNSKDFNLLFQHLRSYTNIPDKYWKMVESIENAGKKLNELKEHISSYKVNVKDEHKKNHFLLSLNRLTKILLEKSAEEINSNKLQVKEKGTSAFFHAYYDEIYIIRFDKRFFTKDEIEECLSGLSKDENFQTMLKDAIGRREEVDKSYDEFMEEVKDIINDIDHHGEKLKGKCDKCRELELG